MNNSKYYAEIGMQAAKRAARKVIERAIRDNRPIPIWKDGKVVYEIPALPKESDIS